jgi:hypothetical protein
MGKDTLADATAVDDQGWETLVEPFGENFPFADPGDTLIGTLYGSKIVSMPDLNNPGEMRDQIVYEIVDENGKKWSVWGSFNIEQALADVGEGEQVRIEFAGKVPTSKPGQTVKQFKVAVKRG